ncbi:hypothetical protein PsYK624_107010 [Phanerochaete sordida]|uniref:Uncharacterized protein n=1 Tax=Phanerochaete sordida TaxID=48140 RepID=A0A9P3GGT1_9APHY|nr:hypothetical protein PsYK624_107010 [Phanerochaete sordida]
MTANWASWRQLDCGVNYKGNHYCRFIFGLKNGDWGRAYRYYNADGSYYYRTSNGMGYYFDERRRRHHVSTYAADGTVKAREHLPMEDEKSTTVSVDAFPETPVKVEEQELKLEEAEVEMKLEEAEVGLGDASVKIEAR